MTGGSFVKCFAERVWGREGEKPFGPNRQGSYEDVSFKGEFFFEEE